VSALLLTCCLSLFACSPQDEPVWQRGLTSPQLAALLKQLTAQQRTVKDLTISIGGGQLLFDIATIDNPDDAPWLALINMNPRRFREASQDYAADGYRIAVHQSARLNRRVYHTAVWIRDENSASLQLPDGPFPESGETAAGLQSLDELMRSFLADEHLPGATLAVSWQGRLVYSRGFGFADVESAEPMQPDARMRIASVSKPLTAVAILQNVERGRLDLDEPVLDLLIREGSIPRLQAAEDERWNAITARQLLHHTAGWDRDRTPDPMFQSVKIRRVLQLSRPPAPADYIRFQAMQPLDFDPGTRYAYSNIGYCLLGRVIECVTGSPYNDYVLSRVLQPAGMRHTAPGRVRREDRLPGEVVYHSQQEKRQPPFWLETRRANRRAAPELVPEQYGRWDLEAMDSHGGWVSSAPDLLRFVRQLESTEDPLLGPEAFAQMLERPPTADSGLWYAAGWNVRPGPAGTTTWWHTGSLVGTSSLLVRRHDGWSWAVLFNCDRCPDDQQCALKLDPLVHQAIARVGEIPDLDLFQKHP
jgi:CubicO group peptidase (beta-lactamase class C family)